MRSLELQAPDDNGVALPAGFTSRIVARSTETVAGTNYVWHNAPDGGACFDAGDGGRFQVLAGQVFADRVSG